MPLISPPPPIKKHLRSNYIVKVVGVDIEFEIQSDGLDIDDKGFYKFWNKTIHNNYEILGYFPINLTVIYNIEQIKNQQQ